MKIRPIPIRADCEFCTDVNINCFIITFEMADAIFLICDHCIEVTQKILELVDIKESEA